MSECELCQPTDDVIYINNDLRVVLVNDVNYPGFCRVIWQSHVAELTDLTPSERSTLMKTVCLVETCIRNVMHPDKINLASLGNMVPHLHWHVIPRFVDDIHFPQPIWGQIQRPPSQQLGNRQAQVTQLAQVIKATLSDVFNDA